MNHAVPGVNAGYITRHKLLEDHLRTQQQAISGAVFAALEKPLGHPAAIRDWLGSRAARQVVLAAIVHQDCSQIVEIAKTSQREAA
jgi:hypothetical protein